MDLAPGCWLGDWTLEAPLGQGGFGRVYRARHGVTGAVAAIKVARDRHDLRPLALDHPGIVRTLEEHLDHDPPFVVMELVLGGSLRDALRAGPLPPPRVAEVVSQVAAALDHAHAQGVLHLDVKPENVLVDADGRYKLADFGGPRPEVELQALAHSLRVSGDLRLAATRDYAAPELREGAARIDRRADVYSLGVVAYELLTGRLPMGLDRPSELVPALPRAVDAVLERALARSPDRRTLSAGALAADLARALTAPAAPPAAPPRERRRSLLPVGLALAVAALAGGVAFLGLSPDGWSFARRSTPLEARLRPLLAALPPGARVTVLPPLDLAERGETARARAARRELEEAVARAGRAPTGRGGVAAPDLAGLFDRASREDLQRAAGCDAALHAVLPDDGRPAWLALIDLATWSVVATTPPSDEAVARLGRRAAEALRARRELRAVALLPIVDAAHGVSNRATAALDMDLLAAFVQGGAGRVTVRARPGVVERLRESGGEVRRALSVGLALEGRLDAAAGRLVVALRDLESGAVPWADAAPLQGLGGYDVGLDIDRFTADSAAVDGLLAERLDRLFAAQASAELSRAIDRARAHLAAGRPEEAVDLLRRLRARGRPFAAHVEPALLLGRAHEAQGDLAAAMAALEEARGLAPDDPRVHDELARLAILRARALFRVGKRPWWRDDDEACFEEARRVLRRLDGLELAAERRAEVEALLERIEDEL